VSENDPHLKPNAKFSAAALITFPTWWPQSRPRSPSSMRAKATQIKVDASQLTDPEKLKQF
jgi:hypothetical protein